MDPSILDYLTIGYLGAELSPALIVLWRRAGDRTRSKVALFSLVLFLIDIITIATAEPGQPNSIWLDYLVHPIEVGLALAILYDWQVTTIGRRTLTWAAPAYLIGVVGLFAFLENSVTFSFLVGPLSGLAILCLVLYTMVGRSLDEQGPLRRRDWFWVCTGMALYFGAEVTVEPIQRLVHTGHALSLALGLKLLIEGAGLLTIARGMLCPSGPAGPA